MVRVDEARKHDPVRGVDYADVVTRHRDLRPDLADLAILDQHVALGEIADRPVEGEHEAALDEDAALALHARELGIAGKGALRAGWAGKQPRGGRAGRESRTRREQRPPRWHDNWRCSRIVAVLIAH
jgi:hypothetical protein